ncbi:MAG: tetratricopeptide repeat protein, partial [Chlorobiales bacterium]|nr:tetratricopeptide repeat protein [Chlorobiales bacterium]
RLACGMPLGINLAASWVRTLSCKEIADEIEKNLDFLTVDDTDLPMRHRSLRHVFEQSWVNLSENEKLVLKRFSVFRGGCSKGAAQQIAGASLLTLSSLIDKSLLSRKSSGGDELQSRYDFHELLRQYAEEKLVKDPDDNYKTRRLHCEYYVEYVKQRAASLISGNQVQSVAEIEEEIANIHVAWEWAASQEEYEVLSLLVGVLTHFYDICGRYQSAMESFDSLIEKLSAKGFIPTQADDEKDTLRLVLLGKLLLRQGFLHSRLSRYKKAKALIERSLTIFRRLNGFEDELAFALNYLGHAECFIGEYSSSAIHCQEALEIRKKLDDMVRVGDTLINIGFGAYMTGDFASAKSIAERIVEIADEKGDQRGLAIGLGSLAYVDLELGNYDEAERAFERSIATCEEMGLQWFTPWFMTHSGMVAKAKGEYEKAETICTNALTLAQEIGDQFRQIHALLNLASIKAGRGYLDDAHQAAMQAVRMSKEVDHYFGLARSLNVLAEVAFA